MTVKLRDSEPGLHHVTVGSTGPIAYYTDHIDRLDWLRRFILVVDRHGWKCLLLCQMTTHVHLILDVADRSLPEGMQRLNGRYGTEFNARHGRRGALIRRRYWSKRITTEEQLLATYRYAVLNPVRAGICDRPEEWFWSSFATSCGIATTFPFVDASPVLSAFDPRPNVPPRLLLGLFGDG
jgi:REP element-mobilizing transposase RayT